MNPLFCRRSLALLAAGAGFAISATAWAAPPASYPSADAAATALVDAVKAHDSAAIAKTLGSEWKTYIPDADGDDAQTFLDAYAAGHKIVEADGKAHLQVGKNDWTLPIPMVQKGGAWTFDLVAAKEEIRLRQIGRDELDTQQAILAYYDAQREYATVDRDGDGIHEYAQKFLSTPGKHDGLYWEAKDDEEQSPLGPVFADAGPSADQTFHGYQYRILTAQGPSAPGGAYDYIVGGRMRNGFAAIAWPAKYGKTGVMTFMVSHDGEVFEKDIGKNTATVAAAIKTFDPDDSWHQDEDLAK